LIKAPGSPDKDYKIFSGLFFMPGLEKEVIRTQAENKKPIRA